MKIPASNLSNALATVAGSVPSKAILPISTCVMVRAGKICEFITTDLTVTSVSSTAFEGDPFSFCVEHKKFSDIVRKFPKDMSLFLEKGKGNITIKNEDESKVYVIQTADSNDFPAVPEVNGGEIKVSTNDFVEAGTTARVFINERDDLSPQLAAINIFPCGDHVEVLGASHAVFASIKVKCSSPLDKPFLIPPYIFSMFKSEAKDTTSISHNDSMVKIKTSDITVYTQKVNYKPLEMVHKIISKAEKEKHFDILLSDFRGAVSRLSTFVDEKNIFYLNFDVKDKFVTFQAFSEPDRGSWGMEKLSVNQHMDDVSIRCIGDHVLNVLSRMKSSSIQVYVRGEKDPIIIKSSEDASRLFLIGLLK